MEGGRKGAKKEGGMARERVVEGHRNQVGLELKGKEAKLEEKKLAGKERGKEQRGEKEDEREAWG